MRFIPGAEIESPRMDALLGVGTSFNSLVALYQGNSDYREEEPFFKQQLEKDERTYEPDHPGVAWSLNNLADLYRALGRYTDAQPLFDRALKLLSRTNGPTHPSVPFVFNNLAGMQILKRNYVEAEALAKRALEILEASFPSDQPCLAPARNNLATAYYAQAKACPRRKAVQTRHRNMEHRRRTGSFRTLRQLEQFGYALSGIGEV